MQLRLRQNLGPVVRAELFYCTQTASPGTDEKQQLKHDQRLQRTQNWTASNVSCP